MSAGREAGMPKNIFVLTGAGDLGGERAWHVSRQEGRGVSGEVRSDEAGDARSLRPRSRIGARVL